MSFSSILVKWREQEAEKLRKFITYSLLASATLHIGMLAFGISNVFKNKAPDISSKPIEVTIIEPLLPSQKKISKLKILKAQGEQKSGVGGDGKPSISLLGKSNNISSNNLTNRKISNSYPSIIQQLIPLQIQPIKPKLNSPNIPSTFRQIQRQVENKVERKLENVKKEIDTKNVIPPVISQPASKTDIVTKIEATIKPVANPSATPTAIPTTHEYTTSTGDNLTKSPTNFSSDRMRKLLADGRNGIVGKSENLNSGNNSGNNGNGNIGNSITGTAIGTGNGTGIGTGNGTGNGVKPKPTEEPKVALAELTVGIAPIPKSPSSSKLSRADCQECNIKYPESARKQKIEGNPEVALDYDDKGRVSNVRLSRSSGNRELDEALLEQARNFKLKPSEGGKQGVRVSANFTIEGSQNYRDAIARKRKREERQQRESISSANNSTEETPKIRRLRRESITDVPPAVNSSNPEEIPKRQINTNTSNQSSGKTESNRRIESNPTEKPRRNQRKKAENSEQTNQSQESNNGTRKKRLGRLRDILRSREQPESSVPTVPIVDESQSVAPSTPQRESNGETGNGN